MAFFNKLFGKAQEPAPAQEAKLKKEKEPVKREPELSLGSWLAIKGASKEQIAQVLEMSEITACDWDTGIQRSKQSATSIFVTDQINGYNLVIGNALPDLAYRTKAAQWVTALGIFFPAIYFFMAQQNVGLYAFAQVENKTLKRIYAVSQGSVRVNRGGMSDAEEMLKLKFPSTDDELFDDAQFTMPSVESICKLAAHWSIDTNSAKGTGGIIGQIAKI